MILMNITSIFRFWVYPICHNVNAIELALIMVGWHEPKSPVTMLYFYYQFKVISILWEFKRMVVKAQEPLELFASASHFRHHKPLWTFTPDLGQVLWQFFSAQALSVGEPELNHWHWGKTFVCSPDVSAIKSFPGVGKPVFLLSSSDRS